MAHLLLRHLRRRDRRQCLKRGAAPAAAEKEELASLFEGAVGVLRNPSTHRRWIENVDEAAEAIRFADLLMRMLDRVEARSAPFAKS